MSNPAIVIAKICKLLGYLIWICCSFCKQRDEEKHRRTAQTTADRTDRLERENVVLRDRLNRLEQEPQ